MPDNEIDFEETEVQTKRPDILIQGDGTVHVIGLKETFEAHLKDISSTPKDSIGDTYAYALKGYCIKHGIDKNMETMKQKFLEQGE